MPKNHFFVFFVIFFFVASICPGSFSGTATDTGIFNTPLEPLWPVELTYGSFFDTKSHLGGQILQNHPKRGVNRHFQAKLTKH